MKPLRKKHGIPVHTALALFLCLISAAAILFYYGAPPLTGDKRTDTLAGAVILRFFISVFLLVLTIEFFPSCLAGKRVSCKNLLWCIPSLAVAIVNFPFSALINGTAQIVQINLIWLFLIKCVLIGLSEEILFRGIIFRSLLEFFGKKDKSCFLPVLLGSAIFALFHFVNLLDGAGILAVLQQVGYTFLIGAMLSVVLLKTENIWLCVFLHALFDFGGLLISDLGTGNPQDLAFWILTVAVGVLCAVQMIITLTAMVKQHKKPLR